MIFNFVVSHPTSGQATFALTSVDSVVKCSRHIRNLLEDVDMTVESSESIDVGPIMIPPEHFKTFLDFCKDENPCIHLEASFLPPKSEDLVMFWQDSFVDALNYLDVEPAIVKVDPEFVAGLLLYKPEKFIINFIGSLIREITEPLQLSKPLWMAMIACWWSNYRDLSYHNQNFQITLYSMHELALKYLWKWKIFIPKDIVDYLGFGSEVPGASRPVIKTAEGKVSDEIPPDAEEARTHIFKLRDALHEHMPEAWENMIGLFSCTGIVPDVYMKINLDDVEVRHTLNQFSPMFIDFCLAMQELGKQEDERLASYDEEDKVRYLNRRKLPSDYSSDYLIPRIELARNARFVLENVARISKDHNFTVYVRGRVSDANEFRGHDHKSSLRKLEFCPQVNNLPMHDIFRGLKSGATINVNLTALDLNVSYVPQLPSDVKIRVVHDGTEEQAYKFMTLYPSFQYDEEKKMFVKG